MPYTVGQRVQYHSERLDKWIETSVTDAQDEQVQLELKPGAWVPVDHIRYPKGTHIQVELNGVWVSCNVLFTEDDGKVQIGLWYDPKDQARKFRQAAPVEDHEIPAFTPEDQASVMQTVHKVELQALEDDFAVGEEVQYFSKRKKEYFDTTVTVAPRPGDRKVQIALKPGVWIATQELKKKVAANLTGTFLVDAPVPNVPETPSDTALSSSGTVQVLMCAPIYGWNPQWGPHDFREGKDAFRGLVRSAGIPDSNVTELLERHCHRDGVLGAIKKVGSTCGPNDTFLFYYTGHGDTMPDQDGDEDDGQDEAMCTPDRMGNINQGTYLRDDDFANCIVACVKAKHIIVIVDACHSGTICDMSKRQLWHGRSAVSISGCKDNQISHGTGRGGLVTLSMVKTAQTLSSAKGACSAGRFFNQLRNEVHAMKKTIATAGPQTLTLCTPGGCDANDIPWPLIA